MIRLLHSPAASSRARGERGMTITELMVVVVIVGLLAAASRPMFRRDRVSAEGEAFASQVSRSFQQARQEAVGLRLGQRAFVFSDRIEFRSAVAGTPPTAATITSPLRSVLPAPTGITIWSVATSITPPAAKVLTTATYQVIEWNTLGQATIVGVTTPAIALFVRNESTGVTPANQRYRVNVSPLSGNAGVVPTW